MFLRLSGLILLTLLTACSGKVDRSPEVYHPPADADERQTSKMKNLVTKTDEPIVIYGSKKDSPSGIANGTGVANSYLWKASLESMSFMPLISSDSNGGTILTDWYSPPETPNEKFKFNVFVLSNDIQISSIKVTAFKQELQSGQWRSATASKELSRSMEDKILKRAITLRERSTSKK